MRKAKSDSAIFAILKEQNRKWLAIVRRMNKFFGKKIFQDDDFKIFVEKLIPGIKI